MQSITLECPWCGSRSLPSPEVFTLHVSSLHGASASIASRSFPDLSHFNSWLSQVEEGRRDLGGSDPGPSSEDKEYYVHCWRHSLLDCGKRRRLDDNGNVPNVPNATVACTAFLHVRHLTHGAVEVEYCLEHASPSSAPLSSRRSRPLKRANSSLHEGGPHSDCSTPVPSIAMEEDSSPVVDFSPMNDFISARLDSTASRLKALTQVLAQLAVDIGECDTRPVLYA